ncbi:LppU/SCO3897 family protein [Lentzea sp. HUAS TT2]|uniref:LppU/SCO3897 family protein n=1 Tax=Lentzea sp. HUAS TT2 TaxID=3447454 RepID=UPI003F713795
MKLNLPVYGLTVVGAGVFIARDLLAGPDVGDCAAPRASSAKLEPNELKCTSRQAMFEVAAPGAECPPGDYLVTSDSGEKTCYLLDVSKDMCVKPQKYDDRAGPVAVKTSGACRGGDLRVVAALTAVLALVLSGCSGWQEQAGVGECAKQVDVNNTSVEMTQVDCASQEAVYRVSSRERRTMCPEGDYLTESSGRSRTNGKTRLCYVLNVQEGDCLKAVNQYFERVECGAGARRVTKVVDGKSDRALCNGDYSRTYSQPVKTICITD